MTAIHSRKHNRSKQLLMLATALPIGMSTHAATDSATTEAQTGGPDVVAAAHAGADSMPPDQHDGGEF